MRRDERRKAIDNAVALASAHALVPVSVKVGLAAMAEELRDLHERLERIERKEAADAPVR